VKPIWQRAGLLAGFALVAVLALVFGRVVYESRAELESANEHRAQGQVELAVQHYRRAIRWSAPLNPYSGKAVSALESLAEQLEADGDPEGALLAWRSLSGGLAATRTLYSGVPRAREHANQQIARLMSQDRSATIDSSLSADQLAADHRRLLSEEVSPDPFWGSLLLLGMAVWVGALGLLALRGFDSAGRLDWKSARGPLWSALAGFVSLALGLLFA
jgi:H+/Cl- antiporter ClcA